MGGDAPRRRHHLHLQPSTRRWAGSSVRLVGGDAAGRRHQPLRLFGQRPINKSDPNGHVACSLVDTSCGASSSSSAVRVGERTVSSWFLSVTGQTSTSYSASLGLRGYMAANGISGGITASRLNASLNRSPLSPAKTSYLTGLLNAGILSPALAGQLRAMLVPPRAVVTSRGVSGGSRPVAGPGTAGPIAVLPDVMSGEATGSRDCTSGLTACAMLGNADGPVLNDERLLVAEVWFRVPGGTWTLDPTSRTIAVIEIMPPQPVAVLDKTGKG